MSQTNYYWRRQGRGVSKLAIITAMVVIVTVVYLAVLLSSNHLICVYPADYACRSNLHQLDMGLRGYSDDNEGKYPTPSRWADLLKKYVPQTALVCPTEDWSASECGYGMNADCAPNSPGDVVLLFETKGGWNPYGGPEILTTENHGGKGCNILFNDGGVRFVRTDELSTLKWNVEEVNK